MRAIRDIAPEIGFAGQRPRASRKEHSGRAWPGRRVQRRGRGVNRNAAPDENKLPLERLAQIAASLGADVPFFLFGGRALAVNRGDEIYPLPDAPKRTVVVVSPAGNRRPHQGRLRLARSAELTRLTKPNRIWRFCALCWSRQETLSNDFEGPVFSRHPRLGEIQADLLKRGAADAALAGSGSAVFGLFRNPARARRAARAFPEDSVFVVETLSREKYGRAMGWSASADKTAAG